MGGRGTDVAREAASLVILDDNLATIVEAIRSGRRIFDNLQKAMGFICAIHVPIAGVALAPLLLDWPIILSPVHIVFLELVIDPACSIAFEAEPEESDVMSRPPRDPAAPLFGLGKIVSSLLQGAVVLLAVLAVLGFALYRGYSEPDTRAITFVTLVLGMLALIFANRSLSRNMLVMLRTRNPALWCVAGGALAFLTAVLYVPYLCDVFKFAILYPSDLAICLGAAIISLLGVEITKLARR